MRGFALVLFLTCCFAAPVRAQQPISRADSADVLIGAAERLASGDSDELAAALARLVQRRYGDTSAAQRANALLTSLRAGETSRSGRVGLIAFSTIYGAWLGVAIPLMFEADQPETYGVSLLASAPISFFIGREWARGRSVSAGDAGLITWSGTWGTWQGAGWMLVLGEGTECDVVGNCFETDPEFSDVVGAMVGGGLLGIVASGFVADQTDVSGGTATMVGWGSLWGTWFGVVTALIADQEAENETLTAALVGGDVGFGSMAVLAPRWDMSAGRAWLINAAGVMGMAVGGGIDLIVQPSDPDIAILIPAVGSAVGLGIGAYMTRDDDAIRGGMLPVEPSGALLGLRDGDWTVGLPQATPVLLRTDGEPDRTAEVGVRVPLLHARF